MFSSIADVLAYIREQHIEQVDVKVVDLQGRWRRMTYEASRLREHFFAEGTGISLSPYPGFRTVESGDMKVVPDITTAFRDPFFARPTLSFICDMYHNDGTRYDRDPRFVAEKAERYLAQLQPGSAMLMSPELEFYVFDDAFYRTTPDGSSWSVEAHGVGWGESNEPVYRIGLPKCGQIDQPLDRYTELREQIVSRIEEAGIAVKYHHHELGAPGQMEIEVLFDTPVHTADALLVMKYIVKNTALQFGKLATFMPKPLFGHAGSGTHYHQYLKQGERSLFYDAAGYAGLSKLAMHYLAGLLEHTPALMAIGNASTNSYRRFAPGHAAPVKLFYGLSNRSSALRIPGYAVNDREARVEYRMPDATANPYLIVAAQLMAGAAGITGALDPTALGYGPFDVNVFALPADELAKLKDIPTTFERALTALEGDRDFLKVGGVFNDGLIDAFVQLKRSAEVNELAARPHPYEYELYFDL